MKTKKIKKKSIQPKKIEPVVLQEDQEDVLEEVLEIGVAVAGIASLIGGDDGSSDSDFGFGGGDTSGGGSSEDW